MVGCGDGTVNCGEGVVNCGGCVVNVGLSSSSWKALVTVARELRPSTTESSRISGRETDMTCLDRRLRSENTRPSGDLTLNIVLAIQYSADKVT